MTINEVEFNAAFEQLASDAGHALNALVKELVDDHPGFDDIVVLSMLRSKIADIESYSLAYTSNFCHGCGGPLDDDDDCDDSDDDLDLKVEED